MLLTDDFLVGKAWGCSLSAMVHQQRGQWPQADEMFSSQNKFGVESSGICCLTNWKTGEHVLS